jgi:hypothetical protein
MKIKLEYNHLYQFRYTATTEGQINVYDKTPLIFILDIRPNSILGLNFHWIPKKVRIEFFNDVREIMEKTHKVGKKLERMRLTYQLLQKPKYRVGLQAIRMYYISNITSLHNITEPEWNIVFKVSRSFRMRKVYKSNDYKGQ